MIAADKERYVERVVVLMVRRLHMLQLLGRAVDELHHSAAALMWWRGRGRSAALRAGLRLIRARRPT